MRTFLAFAFTAALALQPACTGHECTLIGCGPAFAIDFQANAPWAPGTYLIEVNADGAVGACQITLPLPACGTTSLTCTGTRTWAPSESGCALPAAQQAIAGIVFSVITPATIEVIVSRDGQRLAAQSFTPRYTTSNPNGPDCASTCRGAPNASLTLAP